MVVRSVWHIGVTVRDLERSIEFYTKGFNMRLRHRQVQNSPYSRMLVGYRSAIFEVAQLVFTHSTPPSGHVLELVCYSDPILSQLDTGNAQPGAMHIAFETDDIFANVDALVKLGAKLTSEPQRITAGINAGGYAVYLRDIDNVPLELVQPPIKSRMASTAEVVEA